MTTLRGLPMALKAFPLAAIAILFQSLPAVRGTNCYGCSSCGNGFSYGYCNSCSSSSTWTCSSDGVLACGSCYGGCAFGTCTNCNTFTCTSSSSWNSALAIGLIIGVGIPILIVIGVLICLCVRRRRQSSYTATTVDTQGQELGTTGGYYAPPAYPQGVYGGPPPAPGYTPAPVTGYPAMGYPQGAANCPPGYGQQAVPGQPYPPVPGTYSAAPGYPHQQQQPLGAPPPGYPTPS